MHATQTLIRFRLHLIVPCLAMALFGGSACSFSKSSESISNSVSSPFTSSSDSSESDETRYQEEVAEYSTAFVRAGGGSADAYRRGVAKLAGRRGISDWEAYPETWTEAGRGLGKTKLTEVEALAFAEIWSDGDETRLALMREGFRDER